MHLAISVRFFCFIMMDFLHSRHLIITFLPELDKYPRKAWLLQYLGITAFSGAIQWMLIILEMSCYYMFLLFGWVNNFIIPTLINFLHFRRSDIFNCSNIMIFKRKSGKEKHQKPILRWRNSDYINDNNKEQILLVPDRLVDHRSSMSHMDDMSRIRTERGK